ncbi:pentatricopeptide repeat-containing protein At3g29290 isoform X2 [Mercurialis annua]|uniref:pentatricopeptide repeat-containing protein At3g29290 isoform X2 n=1 Tax=Mercurialis annua TaxID=3986 RepID=UPI002160C1C9|nr:pentatricopeptide repeat-containing protein At3g29290 isoform X2 [Mercurialis annua]
MSLVYYSSLTPFMGELLDNSVPTNLKWNGLACKSSFHIPRNCEDRAGWSSAAKTHRSVCELNVVSMSIKGNTCFGCAQVKMHHLNLLYQSTRTSSLVALSNLVASNGFDFVSEEQHEQKNVIRHGKDEVDVDSFGQYVPPWGNLTVDTEPYSDPKSIVEPLVSPRNTVNFSFDEIRIHSLEGEMDEKVLSGRILMLSRSNKVKSALELFKSMEFAGLRPNSHACNSLISCLLRDELLDHAMRIFKVTKRNGSTTGHTYTLILKAVADLQSCESSLRMFAELGGFSREENDFDIIVYNTMISICGKTNNWVDAERIWRSMQNKGWHGTKITYSLLVSIFARCGQNDLALEAYNEMDQKGIIPKDDTYQAVIGVSAKEGKSELALNIFHNMLNRGVKPNLIACNALINSLGKAGQYKLAFMVFEKVKSLGHKPDAYTWNALLNGLYRANLLADAIQLFESIKRERNSQINEHLYNTALMSCQKLGLWDKALQLLWQLESSGLPVSTTSYNLVIGACETARKPKVALQVYEHMIHQKHIPDTFTHLSLIRSCIWASLWGEVEDILEASNNSTI